MAFTKKHGQWFPFTSHISIHDSVLKSYETLMITPTDYSLNNLPNNVLEHFVEFQFAHNNYKIKINKKSNIKYRKNKKTGKDEPFEALTFFYNYVARNPSKGHSIRFCSGHITKYDKNVPWHHLNHCHETIANAPEKVSVYFDDDRPSGDKGSNIYPIGNKNIHVVYLGQIDWPNIKEFLEQVSSYSA